jgi:hypothetical protein
MFEVTADMSWSSEETPHNGSKTGFTLLKALRFCVVNSGRGPSESIIYEAVQQIKRAVRRPDWNV